MALPTNLTFGKVVGRFMRAVADGLDPDNDPDGIALSGLVVSFTASITQAKDVTTDAPVTIIIDRITGTTDASGVLVDANGSEGVRLLATDNENLNPSGWTWTATISGGGISLIKVTFRMPTDGVLDLATLIQVPANPGAALADWQIAVNQVQALADEAAASAAAAEAAAGGGGSDGGGGGFELPEDGLPKSDLASDVQTSLGKADTALQVAPVTSVASRTGDVELTKADVGLSSVDNTTDANKPVSTAQATALALKLDASQKAAANGVASLGSDGKLVTAQVPDIAITAFLGTVATQAAMLALTGQLGDWAIRSDLGTNWIITGSDPTQLASWTQMSYPASAVLSVNTKTGAVTLVPSDIGAVPTSTTVGGHALTGNVTIAKADVGLGNVDNTADTAKPVSTAQAAANAVVLAAAVQLTGNQTVAGTKTFSTAPVLPLGTAVAGDSGSILSIKVMTAAAYAALGSKVATTLYVIVG